MAAPIENIPRNSNEECKVADDELNMLSPNFNPLKALYSSRPVPLPTSDATKFNNVAEYESRMKGLDRGSRGKKQQEKPEAPSTSVSSRMSKQTDHLDDEQTAALKKRRDRMNRNVLTRMQNMDKGPLSFLRRCVEDRLLVKVWTRGAVDLRGMCKGYIVAFDKHFNLAMIDVDELFRCPLSRDKELKKQIKAEKRYIKYMKQKSTKSSGAQKDLKSADSKNKSTQPGVDDSKSRLGIAPQTVASLEASSASDSDSEIRRECSKLSLKSASGAFQTDMDSIQQSVCKNISDIKQEMLTKSDIKSEGISKEVSPTSQKTEPVSTKTHKETSGSDKQSSLVFLQRHVNQMFIRGDNVVSIALFD